ncbi:hypothetical protein pipiens_000246, partial [Culex pipiens pipiens]
MALQEQRNKANDISPEGGDLTPDSMKADDKMRSLGNIQTYREYKEALRQQRNQTDIYRPKEALPQTPDSGGSTAESPLSNFSPYSSKSAATTPSPSVFTSSNQSSPLSPHHANIAKLNQMNAANGNNGFNPPVNSSPLMSPNRNVMFEDGTATTTSTSSASSTPNKRPVQKVIPSCSVDYAYVKPNSPCKASSGILSHNSVPSSIPKPTANGAHSPSNGNQKPLTATVGYVNNAKPGQKTNKTVSWNRDVPTDKLSFTMRREFDKQKEETELIEQLRQIIETRLKMTLPEDIAPALTDGVVLCHLANHVRPRSVGSIHPKLTMARCRRNVDNFLDACRRIGVDEELICSCQDIVPAPSAPLPAAAAAGDWEHQNQQQASEPDSVEPPNPAAMYGTIVALLRAAELWNVPAVVHQLARPSGPPPPPPPRSHTTTLTAANTNTTTTTELVEQVEHCDAESQQPKKLLEYHFDLQPQAEEDRPVVRAEERHVPGSLDLSSSGRGTVSRRKRKFPASKFGGGGGTDGKRFDQSGRNLNEIVEEECEYDSDIGKFRCRSTSDYEDSESSVNDEDSATAFTPTNAPINDLNTMSPVAAAVTTSVVDFNINAAEEDGEAGGRKIVSKRIEFFENGGGGDKIVNGGAQLRRSVSEEDNAVKTWEPRKSEHPVLSTILCLGTFLFAVVYLYLYPLPNY